MALLRCCSSIKERSQTVDEFGRKDSSVKKVIFVIQSLGLGGAERSLINLLHELSGEQYNIDLLLFKKKGAFLQHVPEWVNVLETPYGMKELYSPVSKAKKFALVKLVGTACAKLFFRNPKKGGAFRWKYFYKRIIGTLPGYYDVAVAYSGSEVQYLVRDSISAKKKLVWIHNDYRTAGYSQKDDLPYFADMDGIVSVSEACVNTLEEIFPAYLEKIYCVENITSSAAVRRQAGSCAPDEYSGVSNVLLSVGRLNPQKGFDMAITAAAQMKQMGVDFRWFIIGEGVLKEKLEKQIQELNVADRVILLGVRENPYPYIRCCTLLVQPSRFEGKSVVLDEAKILGTPVLATCYPTVRDQIAEGSEGLIVPMSPEGIAQGLADALKNPELLCAIRKYLKNHEYGNQAEISKYIDLLG